MPPPRKVDLLPPELKLWLREALTERGFAGYEEVAEVLNGKLEGMRLDLRIRKSAIHAFGQEHREFVRLQEEAGARAKDWLAENDLAAEANRHSVLFQMITTPAFKTMRTMMDPEAVPDAKALGSLGKLLRDVMGSAAVREQMLAAERRAREIMGFG